MPTAPNHDDWISRAEAAKRLHIATSTIRRYEGKTLHPAKVRRGQREVFLFDPSEVAALGHKPVPDHHEPMMSAAALIDASSSLVAQVQTMRKQDQEQIATLLEASIKDREATRSAAKDVLTMMVDTLKAKDERERALQEQNDKLLEEARANLREHHEFRLEEMRTEHSEKRKTNAIEQALQHVGPILPRMAEGITAWLANNPTLKDLASNFIGSSPSEPATAATAQPINAGTTTERHAVLRELASRPGSIAVPMRLLEFLGTLTAEELAELQRSAHPVDLAYLKTEPTDGTQEHATNGAPST